MRNLIFLFLIASFSFASGQSLPEGVTMVTQACTQTQGLFSHNFYRYNEVIAIIEPTGCNYGYFEEENPVISYNADFYMAYKKDTFATESEAIAWLTKAISDYYKPVVIDKWQTLESSIPKLSLEYPANWTFRPDNTDSFFGSKSAKNNKITIMVPTPGGPSEIFLIVRTPNTEKLSTAKVMDWTAMWIRDLNFKTNPAKDIIIGGKTFKTVSNTFMSQMVQHHYWYADDQEIIYINYNMLKEEQVWYPAVLESILKSLKW